MEKGNFYMIEIEPGIYTIPGLSHTKGTLTYSDAVDKIRNHHFKEKSNLTIIPYTSKNCKK